MPDQESEFDLGPQKILDVALEIKKQFDEADQKLNAIAAANAQADFLPNLQDRASVLTAAAAAAQAYADKLKGIADGEQSVSDKLKEQLDLDKAVERARAGLESAQKGLEIAKIQRDEASGRLTPEQAAKKRAELEKKSVDQQQTDHEQAQDDELKRKQDQLKKDRDADPELAKEQKAATDTLTQDEAHRASVKADLPELNKEAADIQAKIDGLESVVEHLSEVARSYGDNPDEIPNIQERQTQLDALRGRQHDINEKRRQFNETQTPEAAAKLQSEADAADDARQAREENARQIRELTDEIRALKETIAATRPIEEQTAGLRKQTADTRANNPTTPQEAKPKPVQPFVGPPVSPEMQTRTDLTVAASATVPGAKIAPNQQQQLQDIAEIMTGHEVRSDMVLQTLKAIMATQKSRDAAFATELQALQAQLHAGQTYGTK